MKTKESLLTIAVMIAALAAPSIGSAWWGHGDEVVLRHGGGTVEVTIVPDRGGRLKLRQDGLNRWVFDGSTKDLVGGSYSIVVDNKSPERIKVVVGVDGLNVYRRSPIVGRADADVGSILSPWETRTLKGWQMDSSTAQQFVFSPPDWSEGKGRTDSQIGLIVVQVYRERRYEYFGLEDKEKIGSSRGAGDARQRSCEIAPSSPQIGTTSGNDVTSRVRTVSFEALTIYPEAWAEIDYGRNGSWNPPPPRTGRLGIAVVDDSGGARIVSVERGSTADAAGLRVGDVITRVDTENRPDARTVADVIRRKGAGAWVFLDIDRGRHQLSLKIRL